MKKLIIVFALLLVFAVPAVATADLLVDDADILTSGEEMKLSEKLEEASENTGLDIVIVTADGLGGKYIRDYADDYYDYNGYGYDGVLLLIDMDSRQWWITGTGDGADIFTSSVINKIGNKLEDDLADEEYEAACNTFITQCVKYAKEDGSFNVGGSFLFALIIGLIVALIVTLVWRGQLRSVRSKSAASDYLKPGSLNITGSRDLYLYSNVTRVKRQQSSSGSHTSSSGRSHSGGGGRF